MKPETAAFLAKARAFLAKAPSMLESGWSDEAGRAAYYAGFHAAQALIFENIGELSKTHSGVQAVFARLVKDDPRFEEELRRFLGRAYAFKTIADYDTGPLSQVTTEQAADAIAAAGRFVDSIAAKIEEE